jgi:PAS domain S-box-containing protein
MRDFEERIQLTQRLDAEMARLRSIVESSGAMIVLVDRELTVIMANSGYTAVTGVAAADAVGRPLKEIVDCPLDPGVLERWLSGPFEPGRVEPVRFANQIRDRQGRQRLISVTATPVLGEGGLVNSIVFLGVDDTERRDAERALFDAVRLATVGEMAATVVHEIMQPLQVIDIARASAEQVLRDATGEGVAPSSAFLQSKLARIASQVERAGRIAGELRAFVRGTAAEEATPFDPATAVHAAVELTQYATRQAGVTVSVSVAEGLPPVMGRVGRFEQVLVNLIVNARDAGGSAVEVSARPLLRDGRTFVQIAVEDTGPGIPSAILPQLFQAFVTTKPRGTGTGLGLRICRRIVEEMNGTIAATNLAEGGARFEIVLPAAGET